MDSLVVEYYAKIMKAESESELLALTIEVQDLIINKEITDEHEMIMLNMALQMKENMFAMIDVMAMNSVKMVFEQINDASGFDPERDQLEEFEKEEAKNFEKEGVLLMSDFDKRKK